MSSRRRKKKTTTIWLPLGTGETAHLSTKDRGGLSCFVWWAEKTRCGLERRCIPSRTNKPPKTHGSTRQRRRWDSETRGKDRQVSGETDICDRGHSDKLQEKTGWAEASWTEHQICSCRWLALDFMFWSDWHLMNNAQTPLELVTIVVSMMLLFWEVLRHIISETEKGKRCLEFSWQKLAVILKSDDSDRMRVHLIRCCLNIPLREGRVGMDMLLLSTLLARVWWVRTIVDCIPSKVTFWHVWWWTLPVGKQKVGKRCPFIYSSACGVKTTWFQGSHITVYHINHLHDGLITEAWRRKNKVLAKCINIAWGCRVNTVVFDFARTAGIFFINLKFKRRIKWQK